jgi:hypothetical protein
VEQFERGTYVSFVARAEAATWIDDTYLHPAGLLHVDSITPTVRRITGDVLARCLKEESGTINVCFNASSLGCDGAGLHILQARKGFHISSVDLLLWFDLLIACFNIDISWNPAALGVVLDNIMITADRELGLLPEPISNGTFVIPPETWRPFDFAGFHRNLTMAERRRILLQRSLKLLVRQYIVL